MVKHTHTIRRLLLTNFLSVFDYFVGLVLKGLKIICGKIMRIDQYSTLSGLN